jgi:hypothetical protein
MQNPVVVRMMEEDQVVVVAVASVDLWESWWQYGQRSLGQFGLDGSAAADQSGTPRNRQRQRAVVAG